MNLFVRIFKQVSNQKFNVEEQSFNIKSIIEDCYIDGHFVVYRGDIYLSFNAAINAHDNRGMDNIIIVEVEFEDSTIHSMLNDYSEDAFFGELKKIYVHSNYKNEIKDITDTYKVLI